MKDNWKQPEKNVFLFERKVKVLVTQLCSTLCDPMACSLPGSSVHGILQARILELVAISFSRGSSQPSDWNWVSCIAGRFYWWSHQQRPFFPSCLSWSICLSIQAVNELRTLKIYSISVVVLFYLWSCFPRFCVWDKERERKEESKWYNQNYIKLLFLIYKYRVKVY